MKKSSARLLLTAAALLLIAGTLFRFAQSWIYAGLIWSGAFGCLVTALNFRDAGSEDDSHFSHTVLPPPQLGNRDAYLVQQMNDKLVEHKNYIHEVGQDMPESLDWKQHV